jgi:hypothetical protein
MATYSNPQPDQSSLCLSFPQVSSPETCVHLSCPSNVPHGSPNPFFSILLPEQYLVRNTNHKALRYVVFSTTLLSRLSEAQIFSSAPYSRIPSAYVPPSIWKTKLHTHTKQLDKLQFCIYYLLYFWIANWKTKHSTPNYNKQSLNSTCS